MNIKQAKARFTELTGLPAKKRYVYTAVWKHKGYVAWFISYALERSNNDHEILDSRNTKYWVALVDFLNMLEEMN